MCFSVNIVKFLTTALFYHTSGGCVWIFKSNCRKYPNLVRTKEKNYFQGCTPQLGSKNYY